MPIYEFKCSDCGCLTSIFIRSIGAAREGELPEPMKDL